MNNVTAHEPHTFSFLSDMYFTLTAQESGIPTVPGYALFTGFNSVGELKAALKDWSEGNPRYPDLTIQTILQSLTKMEDYYIQEGLKERIHPSLTKFIMGAYHDVKEKEDKAAQSSSVNNIMVVFDAPPQLQGTLNALTQNTTPQLTSVQVPKRDGDKATKVIDRKSNSPVIEFDGMTIDI